MESGRGGQHIRRVAVVALVAAITLVVVGEAPASASASQMLSKINSARKSAGKDPVESYSGIADDARRHAQKMADEQRVFDIPNLGKVASGWKSLAQVNGVGPDVNTLFNLFMNSYRSVILGSFNYVGIGTVRDSNDILWVSIIFMNHPDDLNDSGGGGGGGGDGTTTTTTTTTKPPSNTTTTSTTKAPSGGGGGGGGGGGSENDDPPPTTAAPEPGGSTLTEPTTTIGTSAPSAELVVAEPPATTTTTVVAAIVEAAGPADLGAPPPEPAAEPDEGGGINPTLVIGGFTLLGLLGFAWLAMSEEPTAAAGAAPTPIIFRPCSNCGVAFNHGKTDACPRCKAAIA